MKGRKRHLLVDTQGLVIQAVVHSADLSDRVGGRLVLEALAPAKERFPRLRHLWVDGGYRGPFVDWVKRRLGWSVEVVRRLGCEPVQGEGQREAGKPSGFQVLARRWVVERTFAWLSTARRLAKDYEYLPQSSETWIYVAMIRLMVRRLARPQT